MTAVVALGDSFTSGEGVGVRTPPHLTWVARLAARVPGGALTSYAVPGARVGDVRARQLPRLGRPDLVTVLVGLNDVVRTGFDARRVGTDLHGVVTGAAAGGGTVVLGRLHDPCRILAVPAPLRSLVGRRLAEVNAVVDELAELPGVHVVDLGAVDALRSRAGWAVDRVHPSPAGHAALAAAAADVLLSAGWEVQPAAPATPAPVPSRLDRLWWVGRHGAPYVLTHVFDFGGPVLSAWRRPTFDGSSCGLRLDVASRTRRQRMVAR